MLRKAGGLVVQDNAERAEEQKARARGAAGAERRPVRARAARPASARSALRTGSLAEAEAAASRAIEAVPTPARDARAALVHPRASTPTPPRSTTHSRRSARARPSARERAAVEGRALRGWAGTWSAYSTRSSSLPPRARLSRFRQGAAVRAARPLLLAAAARRGGRCLTTTTTSRRRRRAAAPHARARRARARRRGLELSWEEPEATAATRSSASAPLSFADEIEHLVCGEAADGWSEWQDVHVCKVGSCSCEVGVAERGGRRRCGRAWWASRCWAARPSASGCAGATRRARARWPRWRASPTRSGPLTLRRRRQSGAASTCRICCARWRSERRREGVDGLRAGGAVQARARRGRRRHPDQDRLQGFAALGIAKSPFLMGMDAFLQLAKGGAMCKELTNAELQRIFQRANINRIDEDEDDRPDLQLEHPEFVNVLTRCAAERFPKLQGIDKQTQAFLGAHLTPIVEQLMADEIETRRRACARRCCAGTASGSRRRSTRTPPTSTAASPSQSRRKAQWATRRRARPRRRSTRASGPRCWPTASSSTAPSRGARPRSSL